MKLISEELLQGVMTYLSQRPYREVAQALDALAKLPEAPKAPVTDLGNLEQQMRDSLGR